MSTLWAEVVNRYDARACAIYSRHYSARAYKDGRRRTQFAPPGSPLLLLTAGEDALFGWIRNSIERYDKQDGINCFVFRNESLYLASDLIREADALAWEKWEDDRHFSYVDPRKVESRNPGYCFLKAGWRRAGTSKKGLLIFEVMR